MSFVTGKKESGLHVHLQSRYENQNLRPSFVEATVKKKFWRPLVFSETFMIFFEEQKDLSSDAYNGLFHENTEISLRLKILIKAGVLSLK